MQRDLDRLTERTFDLLVIGGGIYGLIVAYDAAQRGLAVALVERDDFGCATSFNHLRTIHGGLRYLQQLNVRRARESVRERRTLARIAPHAVVPMPFALPLYRSITRGRLAMRAGFLVDRLVAAGRNHDVPAALRLPAGHVVSRHTAIERFPGLRRRGLTGAAHWYDYVTPEADRLTFSWAQAAAAHGAVLVNHVEATGVAKDGTRVAGAAVIDRMTGRAFDVKAQVVVNACGGAIDRLLGTVGIASGIPMLKAMNLVTTRDAGDVALGGRSASGRNLFLVPCRRRAIFGTWESTGACAPDDFSAKPAEVAAFISELNDAFPALDLKPGDVTLVHRGVVPAAESGGRVSLAGNEQIRDHAADGVDGLLTVAGAKYTTARAVAERVADRVLQKLRKQAACRTASTTLPGGHVRDAALTVAEARREYDDLVPSDTIPHLVAAYGSGYREILELARTRPDWCGRIAPESPVIGAELVWAARHEMAGTLCDAVLRRTPLGALGYPGDEAAVLAADLVGAERQWTSDQKQREIESLRQFYRVAD